MLFEWITSSVYHIDILLNDVKGNNLQYHYWNIRYWPILYHTKLLFYHFNIICFQKTANK